MKPTYIHQGDLAKFGVDLIELAEKNFPDDPEASLKQASIALAVCLAEYDKKQRKEVSKSVRENAKAWTPIFQALYHGARNQMN